MSGSAHPPKPADAGTPGKYCPAAVSGRTIARTSREHAIPISAIIPTLNAAGSIAATIAAVTACVDEVVITDGGSTDATIALATALGARTIAAPRGRGTQLAAGAAAATSPWLLFLHADTIPGPAWPQAAQDFIANPANTQRAAHFRFALDDDSPHAKRLERWVARRCAWLALPYGDQGLLISRALFDSIGGYKPLPLMEDVDIIRRIGRHRLAALDAAFVTSAKRWQAEGWLRRSARNMTCLALWFLGVPPGRIIRIYGRKNGGADVAVPRPPVPPPSSET